VIAIDPGHGGADPGCEGHGLIEKDLTLRLAFLLRKLAQVAGLPIRLTRERDETVGLAARACRAKTFKAEQVVCLHFDTNPDPRVGRLTCYCDANDQQSQRVAARVIAVAPPMLTEGSRVIFVEPTGWRRRACNVVRAYKAPALLIECAFLSNPRHVEVLYQPFGSTAISTALLCALLSSDDVRKSPPSLDSS
jgi:N-acetylmuramoyl-L-alanine amidase